MSERTCVVCRKACPKELLLRLVVNEGVFTLDLAQRLEGRGAYVHPDTGCLFHKRLWQLLFSSMNRAKAMSRTKVDRLEEERGTGETKNAAPPVADLLEVLRRGLSSEAPRARSEIRRRVEGIVVTLERPAGGEGKPSRPKSGAKFRL